MPKPKILILFCGGTMIMKESEDGALVVIEKEEALRTILNLEPRLKELADFDINYIINIDSTNIEPTHWDRMADVVAENYDQYDGFLMIHGTDTMAYTSSALSFVLQNMGKPLVITGTQIPGSKIETDGRSNLINAARVATMDTSGVMVVFGDKIIQGTHASKISATKLNAFDSLNKRHLGEIRIDIRFNSDNKPRRDGKLELQKGFESNIAVINMFPGFHVDALSRILESGIKGVILRAYGAGNIAYKYIEDVKRAVLKKIPIIISTQCLSGSTLMHTYDVGQQLVKAGAIQAYDMTIESASTKLMWALARGVGYEEIENIIHTDYAGEINERR